MATTSKFLTAEDLLKPEFNDRRVELIEGEVREMSPDSFFHSRLISRICHLFESERVRLKKEDLQIGAGTPGLFIEKDPDTVLAPDLIVLRARKSEIPQSGFMTNVPLIAVEVLSPSNRRSEMHQKIGLYLQFGVGEVWIVNPKTRTVRIEREGAEEESPVELREGDTYKGTRPLEGISIPVSEIFEVLPEQE